MLDLASGLYGGWLQMGEKWGGVSDGGAQENTGCWCMLHIPQVLSA